MSFLSLWTKKSKLRGRWSKIKRYTIKHPRGLQIYYVEFVMIKAGFRQVLHYLSCSLEWFGIKRGFPVQ